MKPGHDCTFDEVEILETDDYEHLKVGMRVLTPCACGETPMDHLALMEGFHEEATRALIAIEPRRALFHWAPVARRKQIIRYGLRPGLRQTASTTRATYVCFGDSPSWAWALSAEMSWTPNGQWDLWQTALDMLEDPVVLPGETRSSGIYEVRTEHRVPKRNLWFVGSRIKT